MVIWRVTVEQSRRPEGGMVAPHTRHRQVREYEVPSFVTEQEVRSMAEMGLQDRFRILNLSKWKELPNG